MKFLDALRSWLSQLSRKKKRVIVFSSDLLLVWFALWLAFFFRLWQGPQLNPFGPHLWLYLTSPCIVFPCFIKLGLYRSVIRFFSLETFVAITKAAILSSLIFALLMLWNRNASIVPRSVIPNFTLILIFLFSASRIVARYFLLKVPLLQLLSLSIVKKDKNNLGKKVAIYGAGSAGMQLLGALAQNKSYQVVAFIDRSESLANRIIAGLWVYSPKHIKQMLKETEAQEILLAMPSISRKVRALIVDELAGFSLPVRTMPDLADLASGKLQVADLREIDIIDLLGREVVQPDFSLLQLCISGKTVMVTGAGGSIGSELCRQIIKLNPIALVLYEQSEFNLYRIYEELQGILEAKKVELIPLLGSVQNKARMVDVMQGYSVKTLYHAAAYKHVPLVEFNVVQGFNNNVFGTLNAAQAAILAEVENFVLISTDKAVRPTNVMGATKRIAEMLLQALAANEVEQFSNTSPVAGHKTQFVMVRFGNVLGSSGSVIPKFRAQIQAGGPVTVTHPEITRYFMTIPEASALVIQAGSLGSNGDVLVLDMGSPVKILDLANKMIELSGLKSSVQHQEADIDIEFTGLRAGEKMYEELLIDHNFVQMTEHPMIMKAQEAYLPWVEIKEKIDELVQLAARNQLDVLRERLICLAGGNRSSVQIGESFYHKFTD